MMTHKNKTQFQVSTKNIKKKINNIDRHFSTKKEEVIERSKSRSSEKIDAQILGNKTDEKQKEKKEEGKKQVENEKRR